MASWLAGWLADRLAGWLAGRQAGWLAGRLAGWLAGRLAGWLAGWLGYGHTAPMRACPRTARTACAGALALRTEAGSYPCEKFRSCLGYDLWGMIQGRAYIDSVRKVKSKQEIIPQERQKIIPLRKARTYP